MSDPQNVNNDPNYNDDENRQFADGRPLDVSGSFAVAQNPDQFFQGAIPLSEERGPDQPTAFTRTEGTPGAHTSVTAAGPAPLPGPAGSAPGAATVASGSQPAYSLGATSDPSQSTAPGAQYTQPPQGHPQPATQAFNPAIFNQDEIPVYDPKIVEEQVRQAAEQAAAAQVTAQAAAHASAQAAQAAAQVQMQMPPGAPGAPNLQGSAPQSAPSGPDFFDETNRTADRSGPAIPTQPQAIPGSTQGAVPGYNFNPTPQPQLQDGRRVPIGFFDANEAAGGTTGGAGPKGASGSSSSSSSSSSGPGGAPQSPQYTGGLSAEQAFFFGGVAPPPSHQQAPQPEKAASFDNFYQAPSSKAEQIQHDLQAAQNLQNLQASQNQPPAEGQTEERELTLAEIAQQQYDEYLENLRRQQEAPQQFYDPHEQAYLESANTARAAAEAAAQAAALSGGLGMDDQQKEDIVWLPPTHLNLPASIKPPKPIEQPKKKRKAAPPPPELYDEDDVDDITRMSDPDEKFKRFERLMTPETKGVLMFTMHQVREILTHPEAFFKKMPQRGNIAEPGLFLMVVIAGSGLLAGVLNFNLLVTVQFVIGNLLQSYVLSFVVWKLCTGMGSQESYEANFRVIAYSQASLVIAGLQFTFLGNHIPGYITLLISLIVGLRLQLIGLKQVHDLPNNQLLLATVIPTIVILIIRYKLFLMQTW
jgi:hypothetical protein